MAHMNQETKKRLLAKAKPLLPSGWKVSYKVNNYSSLYATIKQMPQSDWDMLNDIYAKQYHWFDTPSLSQSSGISYDLNHDFGGQPAMDKASNPERLKEILAWWNALDSENYDNSDIQADYFDIGYYLWVQFHPQMTFV